MWIVRRCASRTWRAPAECEAHQDELDNAAMLNASNSMASNLDAPRCINGQRVRPTPPSDDSPSTAEGPGGGTGWGTSDQSNLVNEQACDSLRHQGQSMVTKIGLSKCDVCAVTESHRTIVEALLEHVNETWGTMVMHTQLFSDDLLQHEHPHHEVLLSCKPHRPGCHQWRPQQVHAEPRNSNQMWSWRDTWMPSTTVEWLQYQCRALGRIWQGRDLELHWDWGISSQCESEWQLPRVRKDRSWVGSGHSSHPS